MKELWKKIEFLPITFELVDEDDRNDSLRIDKERFPRLEAKPQPKSSEYVVHDLVYDQLL